MIFIAQQYNGAAIKRKKLFFQGGSQTIVFPSALNSNLGALTISNSALKWIEVLKFELFVSSFFVYRYFKAHRGLELERSVLICMYYRLRHAFYNEFDI